MKQRWFLAGLSLLLIGSLGACSLPAFTAPPPDSTNTSTEPAGTVVRITRWPNCDLAAFQLLMDEYSETNPHGIRVEVKMLPRDRFTETLNLQMTSGEGADILGLKSDQVYYYAGRNWILDLKDRADLSVVENYPDWAKHYQKMFQYNDNFYAIPSTQITFRLLYNKALLPSGRPPETIAELETMTEAISRNGVGKNQYGLGLALGEEWSGMVLSMEAPLTSSGVYYFDYSEDKYTLAGYKDWFELVERLRGNGSLYPGVLSLRQDVVRPQFAEGSIGMIYADSGEPYLLEKKYGTSIDWGVAMPPVWLQTAQAASKLQISPGVCYAVNTASSQQEAAIQVWEYLHSAEFMQKSMKAGLEIPVLDEVLRNTANLPDVRGFEDFLPTEAEAVYPVTPMEMDEHFRLSLYYGELEGGPDVEAALLQAEMTLNEMYSHKRAFPNFPYGRYRMPEFDPSKPEPSWFPLA